MPKVPAASAPRPSRKPANERHPNQRGSRAPRRQPEHAALAGSGASATRPRAAPPAATASTTWPSSRRCAARCSRRTTSLRRSRSRSSAARARAARRACSRRSTASTTRWPTATWRSRCRCARSSARSRSCCCRRSSWPRSARAARPSTSSPAAGPRAGCTPPAASRRPPRRDEGVLLFDASAGLTAEALHVQALELALRRAGFRVLLLSIGLAQERVSRAMRALDPTALVLCGNGRDARRRRPARLRRAPARARRRRCTSTAGRCRSPGRTRSRRSAQSPSEATQTLKTLVDAGAPARADGEPRLLRGRALAPAAPT